MGWDRVVGIPCGSCESVGKFSENKRAARARTSMQINVQEVRMLECWLRRRLESFLRRGRIVGMSLGSGESVGEFSGNKGEQEFELGHRCR